MKPIKNLLSGLFIIGGLVALAGFIQAQVATTEPATTNIDWRTASDLQVMLAAIETTTPLPATDAPDGGNFYTVQHAGEWPPLPGDIYGLPFWDLGGGFYLLDDRDFDYAAFAQQNAALHETARAMGLEMDNDDAGSTFTIDTNSLWLEITNVANGLAYLNLHNGTDYVYEVWSKQDLLATNWDIETEVFPDTNQDVMPFTVSQLDRTNLFIWARDWTGITSGGNTVPEWWFWEYFATVDLSDTNLDGVGNTLLDDYNWDIDPNFILFSLQFTNSDLDSSFASGTINLQAGVPFYEAVLVNDTNFNDAVWQPFTSTNLTVSLSNGLCTVSVGLNGLVSNARQTWREVQLTVNTTALSLVVTNPASSTVYTPVIQLQGYANKPFSSLTYDISNAVGMVADQAGYSTSSFYDTNWGMLTTNYFECYDIQLTNGLNTITLHATDLAGNTTAANFNFTLNSGDTNPPELTLLWPQNGMEISGSNFTAQAQIDDATATAVASMNGDTNTIAGLVERSGLVWFNNLPLAAGTNSLNITVTDAAGNMSATNIEIVQSTTMLTIDPFSNSQYNQSLVTVTGTIDNPSDTITVNGVQASVDGSGNWTATNAPVNPTGTASLDVEVTDAENNPLGSQIVNQPQPPLVVLADYQLKTGSSSDGNGQNQTVQWDWQADGSWSVTSYESMSGGWLEDGHDPYIPPDGAGYTPPVVTSDQGETFAPTWQNSQAGGTENGVNYQTSIQTKLMIVPGGQTAGAGTALYLVQLAGKEFSDLASDPNTANLNLGGSAEGDLPMPPEWLQVNGQTLVNSGITNGDGSVPGYALVSGPAGAVVPFTVTATQHYTNNDYTFNRVQALNFRLTVVSNSAVQINGTTNWATVKTTTNDYVIVQAMIDNASDVLLSNVANVIQWNGGEAVPGNPLQRMVTKTYSVETTVTASLGSASQSVNVWVIWANLTIKVTGTLDPDDKATNFLQNASWPTNYNNYNFGGGNGLGPIDCLSNTNLNYAYTIGKMEAKAILQPSGIGNLLTNGWDMKRTRIVIAWDNGGLPSVSYPPPGTDDTSPNSVKCLNPANGDIFDLDAPGCSVDLSGTTINHTAEVYANFFEYVTVNLGGNQVCSDTNTWSYTAQVDVDATNKVQLNSLSTSLITLPTASQYTQR
jgi:hypothetical protein